MDFIEFQCDFTYEGEPCCFYVKGRLFESGHFNGYCVAEHRSFANLNVLPVTHVATGVYKEGLGISVLLFSLKPGIAPFIFRGAYHKDNSIGGDVHTIMIGQTMILGQEGVLPFVQYDNEGKAKFDLTTHAEGTYQDYVTIESINEHGKKLKDSLCAKMYNNSLKPEGIKDMLKDLENIYEYENGEQYVASTSDEMQ